MSISTIIPGYYTLDQAASVIGVSKSQVSRYATNGLLESVDLGKQLLFKKRAVKAFKRPQRGNPNFGRKK